MLLLSFQVRGLAALVLGTCLLELPQVESSMILHEVFLPAFPLGHQDLSFGFIQSVDPVYSKPNAQYCGGTCIDSFHFA